MVNRNRKFRFVVLLSLLLVGGFLVTSLISYFVARSTVQDQLAEDTLPLTSDNIYSEIQRDLLRPIFISSLMAHDTFLRDWTLAGEADPEKVIRYLSTIQQRYETVTAFFIPEASRRYYHPTGIVKTVSEDDPDDSWYFRVRNMQPDYEINIDADTANRSHMTVFINYRMYDYADNYIGITGVGLALDAVKSLIETYRKRYGREIYFIDREGRITLHGADFSGPANIQERPGMKKLTTQILTAPGGSYSYQRDGRTVHLNSRLVPEFGWTLIVEQEEYPGSQRILDGLLVNLGLSVAITAIVLAVAAITVNGYQRRLEEMATTDPLTGALNRQVFDELMSRMVKASSRRGASLALIMCDIDNFKQVNDLYGHLVGDEAIRLVAQTIRETIRESDVLCRWGGEEFLVLLQDCDKAEAAVLAERIRVAISARPLPQSNGPVPLTVSLGVAQAAAGEQQNSLVDRVDQALFAAKRAGRDRVEQAA